MKQCFVIMPYGGDDEKKRKHFAGVYQSIIAPAAVKAGYNPKRSDITGAPGNITHDIIQDLANSDIVIADLTNANANVFFELGIRHAFRKSGTVHIIDTSHEIPFDIRQYRAIEYTTDLADIAQQIESIVSAIQQRERQPERPDNPVHDAIQDLPFDIREIGDPALRSQLKQTQQALDALQLEKDRLHQKLLEIDPSESFDKAQNDVNVDALLDEAERIMKSTGEHALLRLKSSLADGGNDAFIKELRSILKSPYLDENDFMEIVKICKRLGLDGHRLATLDVARARYPFNEGLLLSLIEAFDDSRHPKDNERGRIMIEEYIKIKHTKDGPELTTSSIKRKQYAMGLLFNLYNKVNKPEWILSIADSADKLNITDVMIERNRAVAFHKLGRDDEAERSYVRAMEMDPKDDQAVSWYADFLDDRGKYEEAYSLFENAIKLDTSDGASYINLGIHVINRGIVRTDDGGFAGPVSQKDRIKAVIPLFTRGIQLTPRQNIVQRVVSVLVRADAVSEAESFAEGRIPEGTHNYAPLNHIETIIGPE